MEDVQSIDVSKTDLKKRLKAQASQVHKEAWDAIVGNMIKIAKKRNPTDPE